MLRPLDWGVDLTMQSLTKFYDGHNIGTGGAVVAATDELFEQIKLCQNMHGNIMAPSVAFNVLQTMKSMGLRVRRQSETATEIANWLGGHKKVTRVVYPGTTHPQKELADKYHKDGRSCWRGGTNITEEAVVLGDHVVVLVCRGRRGSWGSIILDLHRE